jgi:putative endonuclease
MIAFIPPLSASVPTNDVIPRLDRGTVVSLLRPYDDWIEAAMFYVYIMTNRMYGTLYVGVTNDIVWRAWEHREALVEGFTKKYGLKLLVYYEEFLSISDAIHRERRLKHWNRAWKVALIEKMNPNWDDLYPSLAAWGRTAPS